MKTLDLTTLALLAGSVALALGAAQTLAADSGFVVVAATGVLAPSDLQGGQQLDDGTRLALEPWGRALIRETAKCGLTHVVVGVGEYVLELADDCSDTADPVMVAARVQRGEVFAERLKETGSGQTDALIQALERESCVFMPRLSEEGESVRQCPSGYALRGLRCTGSFCDDKDLQCCPYLEGGSDPSAKDMASRWISEEFPNAFQSKKFLNGLSCRGPYCDDLLPQQFKSSRLVNAKECDWTAWASESPTAWLECKPGQFMAGIRCRDDYCGDVGLYCCKGRVE